MLAELLHNSGYDVSRAYSGTEAILLIEKKRADLILLDLMLPGLSGEEVFKKILLHIPVIVLNAKTAVSDKVSNLEDNILSITLQFLYIFATLLQKFIFTFIPIKYSTYKKASKIWCFFFFLLFG